MIQPIGYKILDLSNQLEKIAGMGFALLGIRHPSRGHTVCRYISGAIQRQEKGCSMNSLKYRTLQRQAKTLLSQAAQKIVGMRTDRGYVKVEVEAIVSFPYGDGSYWAQTIKVHRTPKRPGQPRNSSR